MARNPSQPRTTTGMELLEDTDMPIEQVASDVLNESSDVQDDVSSQEEEETTTREKWQGGFQRVFASLEEIDANPVLHESGESLDEATAKQFKKFVVHYRAFANNLDQDPDNLHLVYCWARNTNEAQVIVFQQRFNAYAKQYGATRGRRKKFVPEDNMVAMANFFRSTSDVAGIAKFLELCPDYRYIFDNSPQPEFATPKKVLLVNR